jgi:superfamily II DNA/RNA helicase
MIIKDKQQDSGHWYTKTGVPAYTTVGKTGERPTTLRDARKEGFLPSVTTIINIMSKAGLDTWKQQQVLLAALTLPREVNEPEQEWLKRVMQDSKATGREAAERGTAIHAIIESYFEQVYMPEKPLYLDAIDSTLKSAFGSQLWVSEQSFGHHLGYGGKCDLMAKPVNGQGTGYIVDFKTKDTDLDKVDVYFEHEMQLAAYREGLNLPNARCAIVFVNGTTNQVKLVEIEEVQLQKSWECFQHLLRVYQIKNNL